MTNTQIIYEGSLLYGEGEDVPLPFNIRVFKNGSVEITRIDGRPFDEIYYPDYVFHIGTPPGKAVDNKKERVESISLNKLGENENYHLSYFNEGKLKNTSLVHFDTASFEDAKYMASIYSCNISPNDGSFYLGGEFINNVVDAKQMLEDMFEKYDLRDVDPPDLGDLERAISEIFLKEGLEKAKDFDYIMQTIFTPEELVKMEPVVRKYIEMDDFE